MLHGGHPAAGKGSLIGLVLFLLYIELAIGLAVVYRGAAIGITLDVEHRAADGFVVPDELQIGGGLPVCWRLIGHLVVNGHCVTAAAEGVSLRDRDALAVRPRQRNGYFVLPVLKTVLGCRRLVDRQMRRFTTTLGSPQPGASKKQAVAGLAVEQANRYVGLVLHERILEQVRGLQFATLCAQADIEHVRVNADDCYLGCAFGDHGGSCCDCWRSGIGCGWRCGLARGQRRQFTGPRAGSRGNL